MRMASEFLWLALMVSMVGAYTDQSLTRFGYTGNLAPQRWGSLSPSYYLCANGTRQSPINVVTKQAVRDPVLRSLDRDYRLTNGSLYDNGFNVELRYIPTVGTLFVDGRNYTLKQMHWHFPSEHAINGEIFPVELHMVHTINDTQFAVVSILFKYGHPDPLVAKLLPRVEELTRQVRSGNTDATIPVQFLNTKALRRHTNKYYRYVGSVTTPPCTEGVIWNILGKVREISLDQVEKLRAPLPEGFHVNSRPRQALNGRVVRLYSET